MKRLMLALALFGFSFWFGCQKTPNPDNEAKQLESADSTQKGESTTTTEQKPETPHTPSKSSASEPQAVPRKYTLPAGTAISIRLIDEISTETSKPGDSFLASLAEPLTVDGVSLFPKGTSVKGKIISVQKPGKVSGVASIALKLTEIDPKVGNPVPIETNVFAQKAKQEKKKDAAIIGGGAALGTAIGAIAGGKKGAAIGAAAGGAGGTGYVLTTKGKQLKYPSETLVTFKLTEPLTVSR